MYAAPPPGDAASLRLLHAGLFAYAQMTTEEGNGGASGGRREERSGRCLTRHSRDASRGLPCFVRACLLAGTLLSPRAATRGRPHPHRGAKDRHARLGARHHPGHGLDKAADLDIQVVELASTEAGKIALRSGSADMIVSDWLWVARERSLGDNLVFYPYTQHARRRDGAGQFHRSPTSPISRARSSRSPAARSTRAG